MVVLLMLIGTGLIYLIVEKLYARYWNRELTTEIKFSVDHAVCGEQIELVETITNRKYLPLPYVYVKFQIDKSLLFSENDGNSAISDKTYRNDVFSLLHFQRAVRRIPLKCTKRGVYGINDVQIISTGAFMNDVLAMNCRQNTSVTVYPKAADTEKLEIPFQQMMGSIERNRQLYEDKFMFRGIRDYETYDSMSQVNWKASARSGHLMVNQYHESVCQEVCILLNMEAEGAIRQDILSEESISIAAGLVQMFVEQGIQTSLISNGRDVGTKEEICIRSGSGLSHINIVNTVLAGIALELEVREFADVLKELEYENMHNTSETMYILISQNKRDNLKIKFENISNNNGVWIIPYLHGTESGVTHDMEHMIKWEVDYYER